jgi:SPP1 gp7 family putative phage head morphogenesis protein
MKPTNDQQFFINTAIKINKSLFNLADKDVNKLFNLQKDSRDKILNKVADIMLNYTVSNEVLSLNNGEKAKVNKELASLVNSLLKGEYTNEIDVVKGILTNVGINKYYSNSYLLGLGMDFDLEKVSRKAMSDIVNTKIKDELWSNRIWTNKNNVLKILKNELGSFINGDTSVNAIAKVIKDRFNVDAYCSKRLVNTETARVLEQSNDLWCQGNGIESQLFSATLDDKTSEECASLDGQVFKYDDPNKPECPLHPFCRSTLISLPNKDYRPTTRLDNNTRENIDYITYEDWKNDKDLD